MAPYFSVTWCWVRNTAVGMNKSRVWLMRYRVAGQYEEVDTYPSLLAFVQMAFRSTFEAVIIRPVHVHTGTQCFRPFV